MFIWWIKKYFFIANAWCLSICKISLQKSIIETICKEQQLLGTNSQWFSYELYSIQMIPNYFEEIEDN